MIWDRTGLDLPDLCRASDPEMAVALWHEALDRKLQTGQIMVITDRSGHVVFVTAI
jgi:hypothetical protein